jgi:hypothetical protein
MFACKDKQQSFLHRLVRLRPNLVKRILHVSAKKYKYLTEKAIYNIIDVNSQENEWYVKVMFSTILRK